MGKPTVLLCDDNDVVHQSLQRYLHAEGIGVQSVYNGSAALEAVRGGAVDLLILDIMMPGLSGTDVCREVRKISDLPIIMLSARTEEDCRIAALEIGADDYVVKPFSPRELSLKVRRLLTRLCAMDEKQPISFQELTIHPETFEVSVAGQELSMTQKELRVLAYMVSNAGKILSRGQILNAIWGDGNYDIRVVDNVVKRLRQKVCIEGVHFAIHSIYGTGYQLEAIS